MNVHIQVKINNKAEIIVKFFEIASTQLIYFNNLVNEGNSILVKFAAICPHSG